MSLAKRRFRLGVGRLTREMRRGPRVLSRLMTSPVRAWPDFLIIGTMRGGTTALHRYLSLHPEVTPAIRKELHFFDYDFHRGALWYRSHFPLRFRMERTGSVTGEATPNYLFHPLAAERAAQTVPAVRLLVLLRNPVERAHSHWRHAVRQGYEDLGFEEALEEEERRTRTDLDKLAADPRHRSRDLMRFSYLARGHYAEQLERWMGQFPPEAFLILQSEVLYRDTKGLLTEVCRFLGISEWAPERPKPVYGAEGDPLDPATRARLADHFQPHNDRLARLLGRDFDWI